MKKDDVLNVSKAIVAVIPYVGGPLVSLMGDYIPTQREKRIKKALEEIGMKISILENDYHKIINTDGFAFLFEKGLEGIKSNYQEMKIWCFKGIIINGLLKDNVHQQEKEYYLSLVEGLSDLHLRLLSLLYNDKQYLISYKIDTSDKRFENGNWDQVMAGAFPGFDLDIIYSAWSDLHKMSILNNECNRHTMMMTSGFALLRQNHVSDLGRKFISFCIEY